MASYPRPRRSDAQRPEDPFYRPQTWGSTRRLSAIDLIVTEHIEGARGATSAEGLEKCIFPAPDESITKGPW